MSDQRTPEWFARRAGKFTGSRFNALMAQTRYGPSKDRDNLIVTLAIERVLGTCVETFSNEAMRRGTELEPEARAAYAAHMNCEVAETDFVDSDDVPMVGISPDGMIGDDGLVEIKCPFAIAKHWLALKRGEHAVEYKWQIQGQLWVTKRQWCDATSYDPRWPQDRRLAIKRVYRDDGVIAKLRDACIAANDEVNAIADEIRSGNFQPEPEVAF